jgi:DNA-binding response OmpR family regulator
MTNNLTLLYVEDDEIVRENFYEIFSNYFSNIITADNGKTALELYKEHHIDIAILDISIPEINGLNVAAKIREKDKYIEIVMLTAYADKEKLFKAVNLQLFSYLVKPVQQDELDKTLNKLITKLSMDSRVRLSYNYSWEKDTQTLYYNNIAVKISKNEKLLVEFLFNNLHRYYTACELDSEIFHNANGDDNSCNNILQLISRFKKKMLKSYNKENFFIDSVYGLGYKITQ